MRPRTLYLAKFLGLDILITCGWLMLCHDAALALIHAITAGEPTQFILALIALAVGLAIVIGHNVWSGGVLPIVVTVLGWFILLRGVVLLVTPSAALAGVLAAIGFERFYYGYIAVPLALGAYLTYAGFTAERIEAE